MLPAVTEWRRVQPVGGRSSVAQRVNPTRAAWRSAVTSQTTATSTSPAPSDERNDVTAEPHLHDRNDVLTATPPPPKRNDVLAGASQRPTGLSVIDARWLVYTANDDDAPTGRSLWSLDLHALPGSSPRHVLAEPGTRTLVTADGRHLIKLPSGRDRRHAVVQDAPISAPWRG